MTGQVQNEWLFIQHIDEVLSRGQLGHYRLAGAGHLQQILDFVELAPPVNLAKVDKLAFLACELSLERHRQREKEDYVRTPKEVSSARFIDLNVRSLETLGHIKEGVVSFDFRDGFF